MNLSEYLAESILSNNPRYSKVTIRDLDLNIGFDDFVSLISNYCSNEGDYTDKELPFDEKMYTMICDRAKLEKRPVFYTCDISDRYVVIGNKYKQILLIVFVTGKDRMTSANLSVYKPKSGFVLSGIYEYWSLVELPDAIKKMIEGNKV